jgi:hypothetical protein
VLQSRPRLRITALAMRSIVLLAFLVSSGVALAQADGLYQWKDAKGVTHYSDAPPPKGTYKARTVHVREGVATTASAEPARATTAASANCTLAQSNLKRLQAGGNIGPDANGDGKPDSTFTAQQLVEQTQLAQKNIQSYCTPKAAPAP